MACFLVPVTEAIITTTIGKFMESRETPQSVQIRTEDGTLETACKVTFSRKLGWLSKLLWGGSALLAFEHLWHGEITPFFPFLTAANNPVDFAEMLSEMSTVGVSMAALITCVWGGMVAVTHFMEKKISVPEKQK